VTQVPISAKFGGNRPLPTRGGLLFICLLTNGGLTQPSRKVSNPNPTSTVCFLCVLFFTIIRPNGGWKNPSPRVTFPTSSWMAASQQGKPDTGRLSAS